MIEQVLDNVPTAKVLLTTRQMKMKFDTYGNGDVLEVAALDAKQSQVLFEKQTPNIDVDIARLIDPKKDVS